jgi:hypothetical protein
LNKKAQYALYDSSYNVTRSVCAKSPGNLRHGRSSAIMADVKQAIKITVKKYLEYYAPLVELANDNGLIGQVLRRYQDFLPAADKMGGAKRRLPKEASRPESSASS